MIANILNRYAGQLALLLLDEGVAFSIGYQGEYTTFLIQSEVPVGTRKWISVHEVLEVSVTHALIDDSRR